MQAAEIFCRLFLLKKSSTAMKSMLYYKYSNVTIYTRGQGNEKGRPEQFLYFHHST